MKLYQSKVPQIANEVIKTLMQSDSIEVELANVGESELDLVAIMEEYLRRDRSLVESVREYMHRRSVPYNQFGRMRSRRAEEQSHPLGEDVEKFLARQFLENFMISNHVEEVFASDRHILNQILEVLMRHHVDEKAIREEARQKILNISEGSVEYEIALRKAIKEVKLRHGLIQPRR